MGDTYGLGQLDFANVVTYIAEFFGAGIVGSFLEAIIAASIAMLVFGALYRAVLK